MAWITPKTDWTASDRFNISDYNRIKNNIAWLREAGIDVYSYFELDDMGDDITTYDGFWKPSQFNVIEDNLESIQGAYPTSNIGVRKTFFENAPMIDWKELNRIESATLEYHDMVVKQIRLINRIEFRLGNFKGLR